MKIYYAMSISGEHNEDTDKVNFGLIDHLKNYGEVLTELFANPSYKNVGETQLTNKEIHNRDMEWLLSSDVIVAEVSNISLGVGYEIGRAVENNKIVLCLRKKNNRRISAMISGSDKLTFCEYENIDDAKRIITNYMNSI